MIDTTADIFVQLMDFPGKTRETVSSNEDGSFTIFINSRCSYEVQLKAYQHALQHIQQEDFSKDNVQSIEYYAHKQEESYQSETIPAKKYLEDLERLRNRQTQLKRQKKKDEQRVQFLLENSSMFERAEHHYLYGDDL